MIVFGCWSKRRTMSAALARRWELSCPPLAARSKQKFHDVQMTFLCFSTLHSFLLFLRHNEPSLHLRLLNSHNLLRAEQKFHDVQMTFQRCNVKCRRSILLLFSLHQSDDSGCVRRLCLCIYIYIVVVVSCVVWCPRVLVCRGRRGLEEDEEESCSLVVRLLDNNSTRRECLHAVQKMKPTNTSRPVPAFLLSSSPARPSLLLHYTSTIKKKEKN